MIRWLPVSFSLLFFLYSCKPTKHLNGDWLTLDTVNIFSSHKKPVYHPSSERHFDIIHTQLDLRFNWEKEVVLGKATLTLKPYFYAEDTLTLDAKGFEINEIAVVNQKGKQVLQFDYQSNSRMVIVLGRKYSRYDTLTVFIDYTAKPGEQGGEGGMAISDSKGLYFINADGKDTGKSREIWTQGETGNSSAWFPTIDSPNEKMTQEIHLTVDTQFVTLSNGLLVSSKENGDGTRTDFWKQSLPASPYLSMIAVGDFSCTRDNWRGIEVSYYVEPPFEPYSRQIFGNTPEMLEFFSNKLQTPYPWEKYAQVVVREFVSGAMENTSATVHGEFLQRTDRELLDENYEDFISHELFHQWFGDYVTCESWANLPLNESFATYGEYLWREYKYGRDDADEHLSEDLESYLRESKKKKVDLIRFNYEEEEDMFDSHSYAKGGRILHLLRNYLGDEAFFEALTVFLHENKFAAVEIHQLRLAFEKVSGQDLNWFFNQWFFNKGHPELVMTYQYDSTQKTVVVMIGQMQDLKTTPLYRLPMKIDLYVSGKKSSHDVVLEEIFEKFTFDAAAKPDLVNVDADKILLCAKVDIKSDAEWIYQYYNAPLFMDRLEALSNFTRYEKDLPADLFLDALNDKNWNMRILAMENLYKIYPKNKTALLSKLIDRTLHDEKAKVRAKAVSTLSRLVTDDPSQISADEKEKIETTFNHALSDRSYSVIGEALAGIARLNPAKALETAKTFEIEENENIVLAVARIYGDIGTREQAEFFRNKINRLSDFKKTSILQEYAAYLMNQDDETINRGLPILEDYSRTESSWWRRLKGIELIDQIYDEYDERQFETEQKMKKSGKSSPDYGKLQQQLQSVKSQKEKITTLIASIVNDEKDNRVLLFYKNK